MIKKIFQKKEARRIEQTSQVLFNIEKTKRLKDQGEFIETQVLKLYKAFYTEKNRARKKRLQDRIARIIMENYSLLAAPNFSDKLLAVCVALHIV